MYAIEFSEDSFSPQILRLTPMPEHKENLKYEILLTSNLTAMA